MQREEEERAAASGDELAPGTAVGRYTVLGLVGRGGAGAVYAAFDAQLDRRVAVKILRPGATGSSSPEGRARLQREAQAMARLSHPNVVPVFDAGESQAGPFLAMEFVAGTTLRGWLAEKPRTWRQVIAAYVEAGRGLVAAHAAGLVHRDFKPENVLVDAQGRARVTDFGLARSGALSESAPAVPPGGAAAGGATLTATGAFVGTPAYMSPEQLYGRPVDARTDQFAFCVALWEALYGERPFAGETFEALAFAVSLGMVRDPPRGTPVPDRIRRALLQGLAGVPGERWPDMAALLAEIERDPRRLGRLLAAGAVLLAVAALSAGWAGWSARRARLCQGGAERLAGTWDVGARSRVERALAGVGTAWAPAAAAGAVRALDAYAAAWASAWTEACRATRVRGEQSERLLDLRMACLQRRQWELAAVVQQLASADAALAERVLQAAGALRSVDGCADGEALAQVIEPDDPRLREPLEAARRRVAEGRAHLYAGRYAEARDDAEQVAAEARRMGHDALLAEALAVLGDARGNTSEPQAAVAALREAVRAADRARDDAARAGALASLAWFYGDRLGRPDEALAAADEAEAVLARLGRGGDDTRALVLEARGLTHRQAGRYPEAERDLRAALAIRERHAAERPVKVATVLLNLESSVSLQGHPREALEILRQALAIYEAQLGPDHPDTARCYNNIGAVLTEQGQYRAALVPLARALAAKEKALGPDSPELSGTVLNMGETYLALGDPGRGLRLVRRAAALDARLPETIDALYALLALARGERDGGDRRAALATLDRALAVARRHGGPDHPFVADALEEQATLARQSGHPARALALARQALAVDERGKAPPQQRARDELAVAEALLALGRAAEAVPLLGDALGRLAGLSTAPAQEAATRFALARARRRTGAREQARAEAEAARALLAAAEGRDMALRQRIETWLAEGR